MSTDRLPSIPPDHTFSVGFLDVPSDRSGFIELSASEVSGASLDELTNILRERSKAIGEMSTGAIVMAAVKMHAYVMSTYGGEPIVVSAFKMKHEPERDDEDSMRPCPFCQSLDLTVAHVTNRLRHDVSVFQVACEDCGARGPHADVSRFATAEEMDAAANREWNGRLAAQDAEESA